RTRWSPEKSKSSSVDVSQHDIDRTNDGHDIRYEVSPHHAVERLQIDERRRPDVHAIRHDAAVADNVIADFTLRRFDGVIDLARRRFQYLSYFGHDRPGRNILDGLEADQPRLPHLFHPDQITIVRVSGHANRNFEFVLIIRRVRSGLADVPFHATGPQDRPGHAKRDG